VPAEAVLAPRGQQQKLARRGGLTGLSERKAAAMTTRGLVQLLPLDPARPGAAATAATVLARRCRRLEEDARARRDFLACGGLEAIARLLTTPGEAPAAEAPALGLLAALAADSAANRARLLAAPGLLPAALRHLKAGRQPACCVAAVLLANATQAADWKAALTAAGAVGAAVGVLAVAADRPELADGHKQKAAAVLWEVTVAAVDAILDILGLPPTLRLQARRGGQAGAHMQHVIEQQAAGLRKGVKQVPPGHFVLSRAHG
jgi:hypothetical protein